MKSDKKTKNGKFPSKLKIGGLIYEIKYDPTLSEFGLVSFDQQKIFLSATNIDRLKQTLLHEILEIINSEYDLGLQHSTISLLENVLYQILKDNKLEF